MASANITLYKASTSTTLTVDDASAQREGAFSLSVGRGRNQQALPGGRHGDSDRGLGRQSDDHGSRRLRQHGDELHRLAQPDLLGRERDHQLPVHAERDQCRAAPPPTSEPQRRSPSRTASRRVSGSSERSDDPLQGRRDEHHGGRERQLHEQRPLRHRHVRGYVGQRPAASTPALCFPTAASSAGARTTTASSATTRRPTARRRSRSTSKRSRSAPAGTAPAPSPPPARSGAGATTATASSATTRRPTATVPVQASGITNAVAVSKRRLHDLCAGFPPARSTAGAATTTASSGSTRRPRATSPSRYTASATRATSQTSRRSRPVKATSAPCCSTGARLLLGLQRLRPGRGQLDHETGRPRCRSSDFRHGYLTNVTAISAGRYHTCARLSTGAVDCWGRNNHGQLGNNSTAGHQPGDRSRSAASRPPPSERRRIPQLRRPLQRRRRLLGLQQLRPTRRQLRQPSA